MYLENHVSFEKEKTSVSGEFAHQACNDLCVHCLKFGICRILQAILLSEAGLYRHHYRQVLVFLLASVLWPSSSCLFVWRSCDMEQSWQTIPHTLSKLWHSGPHSWVPVYYSWISAFPATHDGSGQRATVIDHRKSLYVPELRLVIRWSQRTWTLFG